MLKLLEGGGYFLQLMYSHHVEFFRFGTSSHQTESIIIICYVCRSPNINKERNKTENIARENPTKEEMLI